MRTQCCGVMQSGQCTDCPYTVPVRPQLGVSVPAETGRIVGYVYTDLTSPKATKCAAIDADVPNGAALYLSPPLPTKEGMMLVPEKLYSHWKALCTGVDWNKGTAAGFHRHHIERMMKDFDAAPKP